MTTNWSHLSVLVTPAYYGFGARDSLNRGAIYVKHQATALARQGHRVALIYVHFDSTLGVYSTTEHDPSGLVSVFVHAKPFKFPFNVFYRMLLTLRVYRYLYPDSPPDVIHGHSFRSALFARPIASLKRIPFVITEHSSQMNNRLPLLRRWLARWAYGSADRVVAVSPGLASTLKRYTNRPVRVVPNLVTDEFFVRDHLETPTPRPFRFVSIGRTDPNKGWDLLISALSRVVTSGRNATLTLGGGGPETDYLRQLAAQLGIEDRVDLVGKLDPQSVRQIIAESHCHVLASRV